MKKFPQVEFTVNWRPYQLDATSPKEGQNKLAMYNQKFGAERIKQMLPRLTEVFANVGLKYSLGGDTGNTLDSHRLAAWAMSKGGPVVQDKLMEEMFTNYFTEEKYLGDRQVLLAAAEKAGLDRKEAEAVLDSDMFEKEVQVEKKKFARGVNGVPFFIVNGEPAVSGGQPPEVFEQIFEEALAA
eukprot:CAMPEP_0180157580 /NCGR_PEP_ID=MMETSP0986-20121125/26332_1 /TAXON_ID=697907 /ORGANISM="non described non described, Strain CCMP2293" /LENGTH=183 /DNA_ID=CAMNT_0022107139 /DNA_START=237 /DNA_END=788 /DNA_ORIENTATION=+